MSRKRETLYGWEFGHSIKNEVRKEKWIRKKCIKSNGYKWYEVDPAFGNSNKIAMKLMSFKT